MKIQYKLSLMAVGILALSSCEKHDFIDDNMAVGEYVPTCYWEVGSTACKAGESFSFKGKYYTEDGYTPAFSSVWYRIIRSESAAASVKFAGSTLSYTQTVASTDTVRSDQKIAEFSHALAAWNGTEYEITGNVPVSSTLSPVTWMNLTEWNETAQSRFEMYYPAGFAEDFIAKVIGYLTSDTYYSALRYVYVNYPFSNEYVAEINTKYNTDLPTDIKIDESDDQAAVADKSDRWYATTEADNSKIVGYYYNSVDANGETIVNELTLDQVTIDEAGNVSYAAVPDAKLQAIYDSAKWVFCRYDDDKGAIVTTVRENYVPAFAEMLQIIKFEEWIYDGKNYAVTFNRSYTLDATYHVQDVDGNEGIASTAYSINVN